MKKSAKVCTMAVWGLNVVLATGCLSVALAKGSPSKGWLYHFYKVGGSHAWTFEPGNKSSEDAAKSACQKFATDHKKTCTGPHTGTALPGDI